VGDEPLILAYQATTVVSPDRVAGAMRAAKLGDAVVMDDGFQNSALAKNLSLLVVDTVAGLGNGLPLPAGPLRAPVGDQLARSQALVLVGDGDRADFIARAAELFGLPILRASLAPEADVAARLLGQKIVAFAGIGRPDKFFATLETMGARLAETRGFPDHHPYSDTEALELLDIARREGAVLATTEKDMMRLEGTGSDALTRLAAESVMVPVRAVLEPDSAATLDTLIQNVLSRYP
jgi:tetraacyldisaccharide 4'-kinase